MKNGFFVLMGILLSIFVLSPRGASADSITTYLTISNETGLPNGENYASVTIAVNSPGLVQFSVDAIDTTFATLGTNFGIQVFGFNTSLDLTTATWTIPTGWDRETGKNLSTFGIFDNDIKGNGSNRQDPLSFSIALAGITGASQFIEQNSEGYHFVAHIADFTYQGFTNTSAWFSNGTPTPAVPEPATMLLLGAGLTGLAGMLRQRVKSQKIRS